MPLPSSAPVTRDAHAEPAGAPGRRTGLVVLWVLVLLSVLPWRTGAYFSGGLDPVVAGKSLLGGLALAGAWLAWGRAPRHRDVRLRSTALVTGYLLVSVLGGWASEALVPSAVLAVRVGLLLATVLLLVSAHEMIEVVLAARDATTVLGLVIAGTGIGTLAAEGRLGGGVLPLNPNDLAMMFGFAVLVHAWQVLERRASRLDRVTALLLLGLVWLTGSRTGLVAVLVALGLAALTYARRPRGVFVVAAVLPPAVLYLLASTGLAEAYFDRAGGGGVLTLNSRTIAWTAALDQPYEFWQTWFGRGLSAKTVGVEGTFWDTQVLDSSWVSAFVQAGVLGTVLLVAWMVGTLVAAARLPHPQRSLYLPMAVFVLLYSVTASGLVDAYVLFLVMLLCSLMTDRAQPDTPSTAGGP